MKYGIVATITIAFTLVMTPVTLTDVPQLISFQGRLYDSAGNPLTGQYEVTFRIYNAETGGSELWSETDSVNCENGLYSLTLGTKSTISLDFDDTFWLGVQVTGDAEEMSPRYRLASVPYAFRAAYADSAGSVYSTMHDHGGETWTGDGTGTGLTLENYGIGLRATGADTGIIVYCPNGPAIFATSGETTGNRGKNDSDPARALMNGAPVVFGSGSGQQTGVLGYSESGDGVYGSSSTKNGVQGYSTSGNGVYGASQFSGTGGSFYSGQGLALHAKSDEGDAGLFEGDVRVWGRLDIKGDVWVAGGKVKMGTDGEIYARSFHTTKTSGGAGRTSGTALQDTIITSGIDSLGNATFNSVQTDLVNAMNVWGFGLHARRNGGGSNTIDSLGIEFFDPTGALIGFWSSTNGDFQTQGNLTADGTKNAAVTTSSYGRRKFYSEEAAEVYFFDRGQGQLINGMVTIALDPVFLEAVTIDEEHPMLVQITLTDDCNGVFITGKTGNSFTVKELMRGTSNTTFDWEVAAKRKGYEDERMEPLTLGAKSTE